MRAAPVVIGTTLLPVLGLALGAFTGTGIWIVAVLGGAVIGGLIALAGVALLAVARSTQEQERDTLVDYVTGLPSSERLSLDLGVVLTDRRQSRAALSLYLLEGLKRYNDAYGRACGDALLKWLAHKLGEAVADQGTVYRMRGAEFAILAHGDEDATTAVVNAAAAALVEAGEGFVITSSLGEAILPKEATAVSDALKLVDHRANARRQAIEGEAEPQLPNDVLDVAGLPAPEFDIAELAVAVGRQLQIPLGALDDLAAAANLRDVGNTAIPSVVLSRPGCGPFGERSRTRRAATAMGQDSGLG